LTLGDLVGQYCNRNCTGCSTSFLAIAGLSCIHISAVNSWPWHNKVKVKSFGGLDISGPSKFTFCQFRRICDPSVSAGLVQRSAAIRRSCYILQMNMVNSRSGCAMMTAPYKHYHDRLLFTISVVSLGLFLININDMN